jgi:5,6,7,8-tetrahydromethanopterin hydro-lyase
MTEFAIEIGEGFHGDGADAAHINTVLGLRDGPVGTAFATALAQPTPGHVPFLAVWAPNVPVEPPTLFVNKATIASDRHGTLTWGAAQAGVAAGVTAHVADRFTRVELSRLVLIVAVWVNPAASDDDLAYHNNRAATFDALARGSAAITDTTNRGDVVDSLSAIAELAAGRAPKNPYFTPRNG